MNDLIQNENQGILGAVNELDLVLSRGQGLFDVNFDDEQVKEGWGKRKICEGHRKELSTNWKSRAYFHFFVKHSNRKPVCSFPEVLEKHESRPLILTKIEINRDEARSILIKEGVLLHIGLRKHLFLINLF